MNKYMIVFIYPSMQIGGIETYIYNHVKNFILNGDIVVWLKEQNGKVNPVYEKLINNDNIVIFNDKFDYKKINDTIAQNNINKVKVISFSPIDFTKAEIFKSKIKDVKVDTFYFVPHFDMQWYYLETRTSGKKCDRIRKRLSAIYSKMNENGNIRYFSNKHIEKMSQNYNLQIDEFSKTRVPPLPIHNALFKEDIFLKNYHRQEFNILCVSRIEFPHKGFVLGLLRDFIILKEKYPNIVLTIVGDGPNKKDLISEIKKVPQYSDSINLVGSISPDELYRFYEDANINISVARCFSLGAECGVLSLPARHYCMECEVYGFSSEEKIFDLNDKPGYSVIDYIEKAINMSEEEYIDNCRKTFEIFQNNRKVNAKSKSFYEISNIDKEPVLTKEEINYIRRQELTKFDIYANILRTRGFVKPVLEKILKTIRIGI